MPKYRVYCNLIVEADNARDVFQYLSEESDFVEKHIIVSEDDPAIDLLPHHDTNEVYADITTK